MKIQQFKSSDTNVSKFVFEFEPKNKNLGSANSFSLRVFNPAGQDDIGGCGQLWYFQEWLKQNKLK